MSLAEAAEIIAIALLMGTTAAPVHSQLSPALSPRTSAQPVLPKVDVNACPFEGCQFGRWTARQKVPMFSTWKRGRITIGTIRRGEIVTAVTGINITFAPARIRVTIDIPAFGLKSGEMIYGYMNIGEGAFGAWFNGYWVDEFDGARITTPDGMGCRRDCNAVLVTPGRSEWWVQVRTARGVGWVKDAERKFDGSDALGGNLMNSGFREMDRPNTRHGPSA